MLVVRVAVTNESLFPVDTPRLAGGAWRYFWREGRQVGRCDHVARRILAKSGDIIWFLISTRGVGDFDRHSQRRANSRKKAGL